MTKEEYIEIAKKPASDWTEEEKEAYYGYLYDQSEARNESISDLADLLSKKSELDSNLAQSIVNSIDNSSRVYQSETKILVDSINYTNKKIDETNSYLIAGFGLLLFFWIAFKLIPLERM